MAEISDLNSRVIVKGQLSDTERARLAMFEAEINSVLPVGTTEAQRLVQEAVVEFLQKRREASAQQLADLRVESRQRILNILESL
jgi:F420-dependent methylenetetrahydromethanopterin dehydrogenase